jgi:hypothetical protein
MAIASPFRAHQEFVSSSAMIIPHVASRLKPVNFIWGIEKPGRSTRDRLGSLDRSTKVAMNMLVLTFLVRISYTLLHCCNTRDSIEGESRFGMGHRL